MANVQGMMSYGYFADAEFDRETAQLCLDAAKRYLRNADVKEPEEERGRKGAGGGRPAL